MNGERKHKDINHIVDDTEKDRIMNEIETSIRVKTENQIMELIQEFASSWSLVGGRYDDGSMLENANNLKQEIRSDYEALQKENAELKATISNLTKAYERESNDCLKALEERDYWSEKADSLSDKISEVFDVPIGEHSNINCPIVEAMKILCGEYVTKFDKESEAQAKRIAETLASKQEDIKQGLDDIQLSMSMFANKEDYLKAVEEQEHIESNQDAGAAKKGARARVLVTRMNVLHKKAISNDGIVSAEHTEGNQELAQRLRDTCEGELEGIVVDIETSKRILDYVLK